VKEKKRNEMNERNCMRGVNNRSLKGNASIIEVNVEENKEELEMSGGFASNELIT